MSLLRKPIIAALCLWMVLLMAYIILRTASTTRLISAMGQAAAQAIRDFPVEPDWQEDAHLYAQNAAYWQRRHQRLYRVLLFVCLWLLVLLIALLIWGAAWHVPGF